MHIVLLICALTMPVVAFFAQRGAFGPDNGTISDRYPTLLVAEGYAFAIWSLIFTLALVFAVWQTLPRQRGNPLLAQIRAPVSWAYAMTTAWMVVFPMQWFWLALVLIWATLAALLFALLALVRSPAGNVLPRWALGLHAGWMSLAVILNTAQVIVAYRLLSTEQMLPWTLLLWALAGGLLWWANTRQRAHPAYVLAALWGLLGVVVKQSASPLNGAATSASVAAALALLLAAHSVRTWRQHGSRARAANTPQAERQARQ